MKLVKRKGINRFDIIENGETVGYLTYSTFGTMVMMKILFNREELKNDVKLKKQIQKAVRTAINYDDKEIEIE